MSSSDTVGAEDVEARLLRAAAVIARASPWQGRSPSATALAAICIAGEVRSLVLEPVARRLASTVVEPLRGDVFLVVSPHTTRAPQSSSSHFVSFNGVLSAPASDEARRAIVNILRPVSVIFGDDAAFWAGGLAERNATFERDFSHVRYFDVAVRFRVALMLVEQAEAARGATYPLVVRTRPDLYMPCNMQLPGRVANASGISDAVEALRSMPPFYAAGNDFVAVMDRPTATVALRHMPLASDVGYCRDPKMRGEWCVRCMVNQNRPITPHYMLLRIAPHNSGPGRGVDLVMECRLWSESLWSRAEAHTMPSLYLQRALSIECQLRAEHCVC